MMSEDLLLSIRGEKLYGDDFTPDRIREWFDDEREAYANLGAKEFATYRYAYHALNIEHGFRHLPERRFKRALCFGGAYGHELLPVIDRVEDVVISDPSEAFEVSDIRGVPVRYVRPRMDGSIAFPDGEFDLLTCFSVLHHIPNVSAVLTEFYRCLAPGGYALIREPIVSMGDWRKPRRGLTMRERGIPLSIMRELLRMTGFRVVRETLCAFPLTSRLRFFLRNPVFNYRAVVRCDRILCALFTWNLRYHATNFAHKIRPAAASYVLSKPGTGYALGH